MDAKQTFGYAKVIIGQGRHFKVSVDLGPGTIRIPIMHQSAADLQGITAVLILKGFTVDASFFNNFHALIRQRVVDAP